MIESTLSFCAAMAFFTFLFNAMPMLEFCASRLGRRTSKETATPITHEDHAEIGLSKAA